MRQQNWHLALTMFSLWAAGVAIAAVSCSAAGNSNQPKPDGGAGTSAGGSGYLGGSGGASLFDAAPSDGSGGGGGIIPDPATCEQAANGHTYVGCDFYPTVTDNIVRPTFDFAAVVANTGSEDAEITVTQGGNPITTAIAPANGLVKIFLPWVEALKSISWIQGQPDNGCSTWAKTNTINAPGGAYHLTSSRPVAVYQFNALEYAAQGGPPGKDWNTPCTQKTCMGELAGKCFSYTNDASLLLPSTALTATYRIAGPGSWTEQGDSGSNFTFPPYFAVTATQDGTVVTVVLSHSGGVAAGGGVPKTAPGGTFQFTLNTGDVEEVISDVANGDADLSGTLVTATAPIQIISGIACSYVPADNPACDHLEQSVLPAETLGKHYFVAQPTNALGATDGHVVRLFGNFDGTHLTYPSGNPGGGPSTINAGDMVELGTVTGDFEVVGDQSFIVGRLMLGMGPDTNTTNIGDPSLSFEVTVEQYRLKYVFLAPDDYEVSYADVIQPMDAVLTLDGATVTQTPTLIGSGYGVNRLKLGTGPNGDGAHLLESTEPVGLQVIGYGSYTSYMYPGGLNLGWIAPPPVK